MEDSFRVRVDKAFGSLLSPSSSSSSASAAPPPPPSPALSSLWSLTDDEIEPRPWRRETEDDHHPEPKLKLDSDFCESFPNGFAQKEVPFDDKMELEKDLEDLAEDDDAGEASVFRASSSKLDKAEDWGNEEWEIKSSIGMDPTLDNEEEEDEHDRVAIGKEKSDDRLYVKDMNDYETDADLYDFLPCSFADAVRDPRVNRIAAKIRLKEDAEAAKKRDAEAARKIESLQVVYERDKEAFVHAKINSLEEQSHMDSNMERHEEISNSKSQKRVRFDTEHRSNSNGPSEVCKDMPMDEALENLTNGCWIKGEAQENMVGACSFVGAQDIQSLSSEIGARKSLTKVYSSERTEETPVATSEHPTEVPAYLRNPSNYKHYTFDSSNDLDEESNRQAYRDFLNLLEKKRTPDLPLNDSVDNFPESVMFIPRRKSGGSSGEGNASSWKQTVGDASKEASYSKGIPICMAVDTGLDESAMEVDEPLTADDRKRSSHRRGRRYRPRSVSASEESSN